MCGFWMSNFLEFLWVGLINILGGFVLFIEICFFFVVECVFGIGLFWFLDLFVIGCVCWWCGRVIEFGIEFVFVY